MSQQSPYEQLGVTKDASFEEIQAAKQRVLAQVGGDRQLQDNVEAAYDAILMDRLKLRQQGKIQVPEGIRFPEKLPVTLPSFTPPTFANSPSWLQDTFERPDRSLILTTTGVYTVLGGLALVPSVATGAALPTLIALGTGFSLYSIDKKQRRFKRALLGSLTALVLGTLVASILIDYLHLPVARIGVPGDVFAGLLILLMLWVASTFTR